MPLDLKITSYSMQVGTWMYGLTLDKTSGCWIVMRWPHNLKHALHIEVLTVEFGFIRSIERSKDGFNSVIKCVTLAEFEAMHDAGQLA